jgi:hypothetical protein
LQPHRKKYWKIPPKENAAFVACMEDVLEVYHRPYDPDVPVICMDESNKQIVSDIISPIACSPGKPKRIDHEYIRKGVADIFIAIEPLTGHVVLRITEQRTRIDWAEFIRNLLVDRYPLARKIVLVMDNLNTHSIASFYAAYPPELALQLSERLEIHYTPKHGSWLNIAEIELSALTTQCLARRFDDIFELRSETAAWEKQRNVRKKSVNWQFKTADARIKLKRVYPQF